MRFFPKIIYSLLLTFGLTNLAQAQYCMPTTDCTEGDGVIEFAIGPFFNQSACEADNGIPGYADFTGLTGMDLGQGVPYNVTLLSGYELQQVSIWIDADNSMSFDSTELILTDEPAGVTPISTTVTIPALPLGTYIMRVQSSYNEPSSPDACTMGTYGETEDYTVNIVAPPSCIPVSGIISTSVESSSAIINWTENGDADTWDVEIVQLGMMPTGFPTTGLNDVANPVTIMDLMPVTTYQVYVRADCGQDDIDVSSWSGPHTFTTACAEFAPPYVETFSSLDQEGNAACWSQADNGDPVNGPTDLGTSLWAEDGFGNVDFTGAMWINLYQGDVAKDWLISPIFDLSASEGYQVEFDFSITTYATTEPGVLGSDDEVVFLISTDAGSSWTALQTWTSADNVPPAGQKIIHDLTAYNGMNVMFAFWATDGVVDDEEDNDIFVDNFFVRTPPTCIEISELTVSDITAFTALVNWAENGSSTVWDLEFGPAGFMPTGNPTAGYDNVSQMVEVSGLDPVTEYDVYVRADCGMDNSSDVSVWIGPVSFTTECDVFMAPYTQDFDVYPYDCWTQADSGNPSTGPVDFGSSSWVDDGFANIGFTGSAKINLYTLGKEDWLISPDIVLMGGNYQVEFDFSITTYADTTAGTLGVDDRVMFLISDDGMASWSTLTAWSVGTPVNPAGEHMVFDLSAYTGSTVNLAFWATEGQVDDVEDNDIFVDNFNITEAGVSPLSVDAVVSNISCNGESDGAIDLMASGGIQPFSYSWSNGSTEEDITGLPPGVYIVTVTDDEGSTIEGAYSISEPPVISPSAIAVDESAAGVQDGSIDLSVDGGTPGYTFVWSTGETTEDISGLAGGTYCVTITDVNGCEETICIDVMAGPDAVNTIDDLEEFRVYPNPVSGNDLYIDFRFGEPKDLQVELVNLLGQSLLQQEIMNVSEGQMKIDAGQIPRGVYMIKVRSMEENQQLIYRVVKQ